MQLALTPLALAAALLAAGAARADPGYYVVTAYDNAGQRAVETRYWSVKHPGSAETIWPEIGASYGVNSRWTTGLLYSTIGPSNWRVQPSNLSWQNDVLLTQGEYPVDVALHTALTRTLGEDGGYAIEYGPALQTDIWRTQLNANLFFDSKLGADAGPARMKYQWQIRHRWHPLLDPGLQGFGELGDWNQWAPAGKQSHRAGPALFGHLGVGEHESLLYQAAYLLGRVYRKQGNMFTVRLQYKF